MVTEHQRRSAHCDQHVGRATPESAQEGILQKMSGRIGQFLCGLSGHERMVQFQRDRMFLRCVSCGHESPGWQLRKAALSARRNPAAERPPARPHLISSRRVA
jgi:hypothetical protein